MKTKHYLLLFICTFSLTFVFFWLMIPNVEYLVLFIVSTLIGLIPVVLLYSSEKNIKDIKEKQETLTEQYTKYVDKLITVLETKELTIDELNTHKLNLLNSQTIKFVDFDKYDKALKLIYEKSTTL